MLMAESEVSGNATHAALANAIRAANAECGCAEGHPGPIKKARYDARTREEALGGT